jgi:hypothetical protein
MSPTGRIGKSRSLTSRQGLRLPANGSDSEDLVDERNTFSDRKGRGDF